ncbi:MAG: 50S ribosomal protein L31e [Candidatus Aenigmarchaeota archaeon]|nr:50S ribosomal protein L31e [Candidatus Aenigmarchaeota archaeon]
MAEKAIEKVYTIPLRGWMKEPRSKRSNRAIREVKIFVTRHTKSKTIKISKGVNELIFSRGFQKPPRRIKVEVKGDKETVQVRLPGENLQEKTEKKSFAKGIKDRLGGGKAKDVKKKELKERVEKELSKEKVDEIVDKAIKEEKAKKPEPSADKVEKELEEIEEAVKEEAA